MKKIAFISPNIDTFSNPTLIHLFEKLIEKEYRILYIGFEQIFIPKYIRDNLDFHELPFNFYDFNKNFWSIVKLIKQYYKLYKTFKIKNKIDTLICVDPMGLVISGRMARLLKFRLIYASFEIFFKEEFTISRKRVIKKLELMYSRNADLIIVQDERREALLKEVNKFRKDAEFLRIPVSPLPVDYSDVNSDLHIPLKIPSDKKVIIYSGTLERWSGIYEVLDLFPEKWDNDYWLVIHSHKTLYEESELMKMIKNLIENNNNITFHNQPFYYYKEYFSFLSKCSIGIAMYFPNDEDIFSGKNIEYIGLSSGKFSTYMMLGIPTITTVNPTFKKLNDKYKFGVTITDVKELPDAIKLIQDNYTEMSEGCKKVYMHELNPDKGLNKIVEYIENK